MASRIQDIREFLCMEKLWEQGRSPWYNYLYMERDTFLIIGFECRSEWTLYAAIAVS